jgi:catechol-2,3-dioxygenase
MHHFQFGVSSLNDLIGQYDHMVQIGAVAHRAANHGQATSYYFRDPDANIVEFSCKNVDSLDDEMSFMSTAAFAANPSGLELDPAEFARRYHNGEPRESLLSLDDAPR